MRLVGGGAPKWVQSSSRGGVAALSAHVRWHEGHPFDKTKMWPGNLQDNLHKLIVMFVVQL